MHTFEKSKIALAVGASLLVVAGAAQASAPALRAAHPMLATAVGATADADIRELLSAAGAVNKAITVDVALTQAPVALAAVATTNLSTTVTATSTAGLVPGMVLSGNAGIPALATVASVTNGTTFEISAAATATAAALTATATPPAGPIVGGVASANDGAITSAAALVMGNATAANNSVIVWAGATNAATVPSTGATASIGNTVSGVAHMTISLPAPGASAAYRVNGATGALEYSANATAATPVWNAVKVDIQQVAGKEIYTEANNTAGNAAGDQALIASTATAVENSLAPTPVVSTTSAVGGSLVNGFKIDTGASITLINANLNVRTRASNAAFPAAALPAAPTCVAATATVNGSCSVAFVGLGTLASAADFDGLNGVDAADVTFYNSSNFNTGVRNATVPWTVDGVNATKASYTNVWNTTDGLAAKLANVGGGAAGDAAAFPATNVVSDGAVPVIVTTAAGAPTAQRPDGTNLQITFSEPIAVIGGGAGDLREVLENVFIGNTSLAALTLNDDLNPTIGVATSAGQGTLTINNLTGGELTSTSTVTVNTGITLQEDNDTGAVAGVPAIDDQFGMENTAYGAMIRLDGGIQTLSSQATTLVESASVTAKAVTPAVVTVDFDNATAFALTTAADPAKVGQIVVTLPLGQEISLASGLTTAALVNQIRVTVSNESSYWNNNNENFQFFPTAGQMALNAAGNQLTITLPTDLIYSKMPAPDGMLVHYLGNTTATQGALVKKASSAVAVASLTATDLVDDGEVLVKMPLSASGPNAGLVTQSIVGSFSTATSGDRVTAHLAHWENAPAADSFSADTLTGSISAPAATSLAFGMGEEGQIRSAVDAQNNAIAKAVAPVPGVSGPVAAVVAKPIALYVVVKDGVATVYDDAANATNASDTIIGNILSAAAQAGWDGSDATGADGSISNNSLSTVTSVAALAAGNASAAAAVLDTNGVPRNTYLAAVNAAAAPGATPATVMKAVMATLADYKVKSASLDPVSGNITGGVTGKLVIKNGTTSTADRGLVIDYSYNADGIVGTVNGNANSFNLLVGVDPANANLNALKMNQFVILVHESAQTGDRTMLTTADPTDVNFVPFNANLLTLSGQRTTLPAFVLANYKVSNETGGGDWTLVALGNQAKKAAPAGHVPSFERAFVGLDGMTPESTWTNDGFGTDMALAMVGNKAFAASEQGSNKATLSTITPTSYITGAAALAVRNDGFFSSRTMFRYQSATPVVATLPVGWSLVTVPASGTVGAAVDAVINVGAQTSAPYTWIKGDTVAPALVAGDAVFVYSKLGGNL